MIPVKPFETYKWRWLSVQPSENLLQAPIFLGVLRALSRHEGEAFSSQSLRDDLATVDSDTRSPVTLAREPSRNLFRNSGQYWRGTGLVKAEHGVIRLTALGRSVAKGRVTQSEFAALMVQQTILPNPATYSAAEIEKWKSVNLNVRPLKLILEVIQGLGQRFGIQAASLNNDELVEILIPLAGAKASVSTIVKHIFLHRVGKLDLSGWPDCAPEANDKRLAREFLLFLANFGFLRLDDSDGLRDKQRFYLDELFDVDASTPPIDTSIFKDDASAEGALDIVRHSPLPAIIERQRVILSVLARPNQSKFRARVIQAYAGRCLITGEEIGEVLEAAHIVPVKNNGTDHENNGICLRVDIHRLFDSGNLRIQPSGILVFSDSVSGSINYKCIPRKIKIPKFVNLANVIWRENYL